MRYFKLYTIILVFYLQSCIPIRVLPYIPDSEVILAKKIKKSLPKHYAFTFKNPKGVGRFYRFIDQKYDKNNVTVANNTVITIANEQYFLSFLGVSAKEKTINLLPIATDLWLESNGNPTVFEQVYTTKSSHQYILLTVFTPDNKDALAPGFIYREKIIHYLKRLKLEYLDPSAYIRSSLQEDL